MINASTKTNTMMTMSETLLPSPVPIERASSSRGMLTGGDVGGSGGTCRGPQSMQSVPSSTHCEYSAPAPPSSQSPSAEYWHVSEQTARGDTCRGPQSMQSVPSSTHAEYSAPAPPSSQSPSAEYSQVSEQTATAQSTRIAWLAVSLPVWTREACICDTLPPRPK